MAAVEEMYARVQSQIERRRPSCVMSGRCCRFEEFGHRLFVTTLELARFIQQSPIARSAWNGTGCPFQRARLCTVHPIRPFGCRIFFCDPSSTEWQNAAYEDFHSQFKRLHEQFRVEYFYLEWRHALRLLDIASPAGPTLAT